MSWMQTHSGRKLDFLNPDSSQIDIEDVAHALSQICRFSGHCQKFYSVAQLCKPENRLAGLLHDATEAYIGDMVSPLKRLIPDFSTYENRLWSIIADKFGVGRTLPPDVKAADLEMLALEARDLMGADPVTWGLQTPTKKVKIAPWTSHIAKIHFMNAFQEYTGEYAASMLRAYATP